MATADKDALAAIERAEAIGASDAVEPLPPLLVKEVPALAATVTDLTSLRTAVVDAAGVSAGLWLSYLFVLCLSHANVRSTTQRRGSTSKPVAVSERLTISTDA